jgi:membrane protein
LRFARILWKSFGDFFRDNGFVLAGSISYFMMMALFPFCLFLITVFGHLLGRYPEFYRFFLARLVNLFPDVTGGITRELLKLVSYQGLGKYSLFLFGSLSYPVFVSLEYSLNAIFRVSKKRNVIFSVFLSLVVVTLIIVLIMASFAAASVVPLLINAGLFPTVFKLGKLTAFFIRFVLPFVGVLFAATAIFRLLPKTNVTLSAAFRGAVFTTVLLEVAKYIFTWYVVSIIQFGKIYGPLTAFVLFLLWMFYSSCIFLIGAELVKNLTVSKKGMR